jgi:hypothetical protein
MKKIILTTALLFSLSTLMFAQFGGTPPTPEESAKRTTEWMKSELKLTDGQVVKVDSINLVFAKKQTEQFQNAQGGDRDARMAAFSKLNDERTVAFEKVLTKEQLDAYKVGAESRRGGGRRN